MSPERLLKHFDQISEAPDAVSRLRRFILDLAMRGKLVEQDPVDEPAEKLLKRIEAEKKRLVKEGRVRALKPLEPVEDIEFPFVIPDSWKWLRLGEIGRIVGGGTPTSTDPDCFTTGGTGIAWLTPADLGKHSGLYISHGARDLTEKGLLTSSAQLMPTGSVLFTSRAPIGYTAIAANEISTNQGFKSVIPFIMEYNRYIAIYFMAFAIWIDSKASGTTFKEVSGKIVSSLPFPLPPLPEQHRIVAKVNELMTLCDELETAQAKRERRRDRLVAATLHGLNSGETGTGTGALPSFQGNARFFFNHLPRLTTRPEHIQQLREAILNLAVRGKLVRQDPKDEPASELMKRIQKEKLRQIKEGKTRREHLLPPINGANEPYALPPGWVWARFPELGIFGRGKSKHRPRNDASLFVGGTHLFVQTGDVARSNGVIETFTAKYNELGLAQSAKWPKGTLCITIAANIADSGILSFDACFPDSVVGFVPSPLFPSARYFEYFIRTAKAQLLEFAPATAQKNINLSILNELLIPLPPLREQQRILAKVDEMMLLCDNLEAWLTSSFAYRRHLLEATLHESLAV